MAATFDPALTLPRDRIRQLLGDTGEDFDVQDETIAYYLTTMGETATAARLARDLAAKYAKKVDTTLDGQSFSYSDISRSYSELAVRLEAQARDEAAVASISGGTGGIIVTGATAQDVYDAWDDTSRAGNAGFRW